VTAPHVVCVRLAAEVCHRREHPEVKGTQSGAGAHRRVSTATGTPSTRTGPDGGGVDEDVERAPARREPQFTAVDQGVSFCRHSQVSQRADQPGDRFRRHRHVKVAWAPPTCAAVGRCRRQQPRRHRPGTALRRAARGVVQGPAPVNGIGPRQGANAASTSCRRRTQAGFAGHRASGPECSLAPEPPQPFGWCSTSLEVEQPAARRARAAGKRRVASQRSVPQPGAGSRVRAGLAVRCPAWSWATRGSRPPSRTSTAKSPH